MHGMKNMFSMGLCECGNVRHRSVKDASYTVTRPGMVFYSVSYDVLTQVLMAITPCRLVKGYGRFGRMCLHLGLLALKMKVNWPVDRAKRPRWLQSSPTPLWEFHHHQMLSRNVGKKLPIGTGKIPKESRSHLHRIRSLKSRNCVSVAWLCNCYTA